MEIGQLEAFLTAVRLHSFSRAASELGVTQPTLSTRILLLENDLGEPLFRPCGQRRAPDRRGTDVRAVRAAGARHAGARQGDGHVEPDGGDGAAAHRRGARHIVGGVAGDTGDVPRALPRRGRGDQDGALVGSAGMGAVGADTGGGVAGAEPPGSGDDAPVRRGDRAGDAPGAPVRAGRSREHLRGGFGSRSSSTTRRARTSC